MAELPELSRATHLLRISSGLQSSLRRSRHQGRFAMCDRVLFPEEAVNLNGEYSKPVSEQTLMRLDGRQLFEPDGRELPSGRCPSSRHGGMSNPGRARPTCQWHWRGPGPPIRARFHRDAAEDDDLRHLRLFCLTEGGFSRRRASSPPPHHTRPALRPRGEYATPPIPCALDARALAGDPWPRRAGLQAPSGPDRAIHTPR